MTVLTDGKSREPREIPQGAGFPHTQPPQKGINTILHHFRDKPARYAVKLAVVTVEAAQIRFIALPPFSARDMFKNALAVIKLHF